MLEVEAALLFLVVVVEELAVVAQAAGLQVLLELVAQLILEVEEAEILVVQLKLTVVRE